MSQPSDRPLPPFPQPGEAPGKTDSGKGESPSAEAPVSPSLSSGPDSLSTAEIREIRRFLSLFGTHWIEKFHLQAPATGAHPPVPVPPAPKADSSAPRAHLMKLCSQAIADAQESEKPFGHAFFKILEEIENEEIFLKTCSALTGIFPLKSALRHGTQEQKLYALTVLSDRFLHQLAGVMFEQRHALFKTTMRYLTDLTEAYAFIQNEGEPFNALHYELAEGSQTGNRTIREVHGFVIIRKNTQHIIRLGRALT